MAGHSKWANIQHRKKAVDAKRGKIFTRVNRELTVAAREGGSDPDANPRLRLAIQKANAANMPKDTIERTIKKATGELEGVSYEEIRYEGYAQGGVAVMIETLTDNRNRTVAEVRHAFTKHGGNLGTDGSVAYLFSKVAQFVLPAGSDEERVMEVALEAGADDVVAVNVSTESLILAGIRRIRAWSRIYRGIGGDLEAVPVPTGNTEPLLRLELTEEEQDILTHHALGKLQAQHARSGQDAGRAGQQ